MRRYLNVPVWRRFLIILSVLLKLPHLPFCLELLKTFSCFSQGFKEGGEKLDCTSFNQKGKKKNPTSFTVLSKIKMLSLFIHLYIPFL